MNYYCCEELRRNAVKDHPFLNGIEYLEVVDNPGDAYADRQTTLIVHFIKDLAADSLGKTNIRIEGGERIKNIEVVDATIGLPASPPSSPLSPLSPPFEDLQKLLVVRVKEAGDFSQYTLRLITDKKNSDPPNGFDPVLSSIPFSFKVLCANDFDCKPECDCQEEPVVQPEINYLARDYASFRQLILDRMSVTMPQWTERNPADIGIMLVEILAYAGDYLSYQQDAIATEAYLGTARKRISIRRLARLVDYGMHDGCNARTWVHLDVADGVVGPINVTKKTGDSIATQFVTQSVSTLPVSFKPNSKFFEKADTEGAKFFEPLHDEEIFQAHNEMKFYTWGERECCLPKGATAATLSGDLSTLQPGQVLIFKEVKGPETGDTADADPSHRQAVRLTKIKLSYDPLFANLDLSPPASPISPGIPVTEITWNEEDALQFPFCISSLNDTFYYDNISVALGNNILVDHGRSYENTTLLDPDTVGESTISAVESSSGCACDKEPPVPIPPKFRPVLKQWPLTFAAPYDPADVSTSATHAMQSSMRDASPGITLTEKGTTEKWIPQRDLLESAANAKEFVVEIERDGIAHIRFGDDELGMRPLE